MNNLKLGNDRVLEIKIAQTGDIIRISLNEKNLRKKFNEIYTSILKELKLKKKSLTYALKMEKWWDILI